VPRALADDSGTAVVSGTGEPQTLAVAAPAEAMTETLEPDLGEVEIPVAAERAGADGQPGTDMAGLAQGTGSGDRSTVEQEQQPTRESMVVAERRPEDQQSRGEQATRDQLAQAGRDEKSHDPTVCPDGGCSTEPQPPKGPTTIAAVRPPDDRGNPGDEFEDPFDDPFFDQFREDEEQASALSNQIEAVRLQVVDLNLQLDNIRRLQSEGEQRGATARVTQRIIEANLAASGPTTQEGMIAELDRLRSEFDQLGSQVLPGTDEEMELRVARERNLEELSEKLLPTRTPSEKMDLMERILRDSDQVFPDSSSPGAQRDHRRFLNEQLLSLHHDVAPRVTEDAALQGRMTELERRVRERLDRLDQLGSEEDPDADQNPMGMVRPEDVGLGQPTPKGQQVVIPKSAGFGGNQPEIPNQTVFTAPRRDTTSPGLIPPVVDNTNPPYTATSAQAVGGGRLAAVNTEWAPVGYVGGGLAVLLAAMLAVGCKGAPCSTMLRPAFRGFQGVPGQVVPGHLQG